MSNCAVANCGNYHRKTKGRNAVRYFRFPKNEDLIKQWLAACKRDDAINVKNAYVCSIHFDANCFELPLRQRLLNYIPKTGRCLKPNSVPTLNLPGRLSPKNNKERLQRLLKRRNQREVNEILNEEIKKTDSTGENSALENSENEFLSPNITTNFPVEHQPSCSCSGEDVIMKLNERIAELERQNAELQTQLKKAKSTISDYYKNLLSKVFTAGQIRKLFQDQEEKQIRWTAEDIASAISLRSVSPKAYRYLRARNYPLPALSTLRRWVSKFDVGPGILRSVCNLMNKKSYDLKDVGRICFISFDEIHISNKIEIDRKKEQKLGPHKTCQTVMVRGLVSNWKQPIYYQFDQPMTKQILEDIIMELYKARFIVVGIVSDMGTSNTKLWTTLNVRYNKNCFFPHPANNKLQIFVFADVPHLLKLARNHLLDHGFTIENHIINVDYFQCLLNVSTSELTLAHKLTQNHLEVRGSMRQRVRPAVQLLSNSVAKAIHYCGEKGLMPKNSFWKEASEVVELFNDWFDLFNAKTQVFDNKPSKNAFGTDFENQIILLKKMNVFAEKMRVGNRKELLPFQRGILLTNRSLVEMYNYLQKEYGIKYILTARMNQDVLENFFSYIRGMGATNDHPSSLDFQYRLKWYIMGKHSEAIFTENRNTVDSNETCLLNILQEQNDYGNDAFCITQKMLLNLADDIAETNVISEEESVMQSSSVQIDHFFEDNEEMTEIMDSCEARESVHREALRYIAGYVAYKFKNKYSLGVPCSHQPSNWIDFISRGSLLQPCDELFNAAVTLETEFLAMHGSSLAPQKNIFRTLAERTVSKLKTSTLPFEVILLLSRTRTYVRLRDLNRKISLKNSKRKLDRKMCKFTNSKK